MFGSKKIKELKAEIQKKENKIKEISHTCLVTSSECYKYKRLFSKLFTCLSASNVKKYKVNNDLTEGLALFYIEYDDGTNYTYEVKLVNTGYEEEMKSDK